MVTRRTLLKTTVATAASSSLLGRALPAGAADLAASGGPARYDALELDHHTGGRFPPGAADAPPALVRGLNGRLVCFSSHANGNTFRHEGDDLDSFGPGVWVWGSAVASDADWNGYAGITSVVRDPANPYLLHGLVHQENHTRIASGNPIATVGYVTSSDEGYHWTWHGTILRGENLQRQGFRGAELPSALPWGGHLLITYGNRPGDGVWQQIHGAIARFARNGGPIDMSSRGLRTLGEIIGEAGAAPHYYARSACFRHLPGWGEWMVVYDTDDSFRYVTRSAPGARVRRRSDLIDFLTTGWGESRLLVDKGSEYSNPTARRRWYPTLMDGSQAEAGWRVGSGNVRLFEHQVTVPVPDPDDRGPYYSVVRFT